MNTISERIIEISKLTSKNMSEFARTLNVTPAYISKLKQNPEAVPSPRFVEDICRKYNANYSWIMDGIGEMFLPMTKETKIAAFFADVQCDEGFKKRFISVLSDLEEEDWVFIEKFALKLTEDLNGKDQEH